MAFAEQPERGLDALAIIVCRSRELRDRERRARDDEQRLERPGEPVERIDGD